jgi:hypothetical protein
MLLEETLEGLLREVAAALAARKSCPGDYVAGMQRAVTLAQRYLPDTFEDGMSAGKAAVIKALSDKLDGIVTRLSSLQDHIESEIEACEELLDYLADTISDEIVEAQDDAGDGDE